MRTDRSDDRKAFNFHPQRRIIDEHGARIAKARFAVYGTSVYPDATFSLRLSYGKIAGWTYRGRTVPPFTDFTGLYTRATGRPRSLSAA